MGWTYPPGPLTLRVHLPSWKSPPAGVGQPKPNNDGGAGQKRAHMDWVSKNFGRTQRSGDRAADRDASQSLFSYQDIPAPVPGGVPKPFAALGY